MEQLHRSGGVYIVPYECLPFHIVEFDYIGTVLARGWPERIRELELEAITKYEKDSEYQQTLLAKAKEMSAYFYPKCKVLLPI